MKEKKGERKFELVGTPDGENVQLQPLAKHLSASQAMRRNKRQKQSNHDCWLNKDAPDGPGARAQPLTPIGAIDATGASSPIKKSYEKHEERETGVSEEQTGGLKGV
jgi:hypothetical protein